MKYDILPILVWDILVMNLCAFRALCVCVCVPVSVCMSVSNFCKSHYLQYICNFSHGGPVFRTVGALGLHAWLLPVISWFDRKKHTKCIQHNFSSALGFPSSSVLVFTLMRKKCEKALKGVQSRTSGTNCWNEILYRTVKITVYPNGVT